MSEDKLNNYQHKQKKYGPKTADNHSVGHECPACHKEFIAGDYTTVIALGPGDDEEEKQKARDGEDYISTAIEIHWACATGHTGEPEEEPKDPRAHLKVIK